MMSSSFSQDPKINRADAARNVFTLVKGFMLRYLI
jgi:hypothetical protein